MRVFAQILVVVALVVATLSASVAYHVPLDRPDEDLVGLTLQDESDVLWVEGSPSDADRVLTSERLAMLRERESASVPKVRVREFSFLRWQAKWIFGAAILAMTAGALILRSQQQAERLIRSQADTGGSPGDRLKACRSAVDALLTEVESTKKPAVACMLIRNRVALVQQEEVASFLASQDTLIAERGLGPAAEILDSFAAAERQLNRAWSAAADEHADEAMTCLRACSSLMPAV